jgi:ABC-type Fe3+/spermidine/putrescine transport system ATPase subunit
VNLFAVVTRPDAGRTVLVAPALKGHVIAGEVALPQPRWAAIRPEKIIVAAEPAEGALPGTVRQIAYLGSQSLLEIDIGGTLVKAVLSAGTHTPNQGEQVWLTWPAAAVVLLPA